MSMTSDLAEILMGLGEIKANFSSVKQERDELQAALTAEQQAHSETKEHLQHYINFADGQNFMSDFRTAKEMRAALEQAKAHATKAESSLAALEAKLIDIKFVDATTQPWLLEIQRWHESFARRMEQAGSPEAYDEHLGFAEKLSTVRAALGTATSNIAHHTASSSDMSLCAFWKAQAAWSQATFGLDSERGPLGPLKHLAKEAAEAQKDPTDLMEFVDCLFLTFDATRRAGFTFDQLCETAWKKLEINKARHWTKPTKGDEAVEHDRSKDASSAVEGDKTP